MVSILWSIEMAINIKPSLSYKYAFMKFLKGKLCKYVFKELRNHGSLTCSALTTSSKPLATIM